MEETINYQFMRGSVPTYGKAVRLIDEVWKRVLKSDLPILSGSPKQRYQDALGLPEAELIGAKISNASALDALRLASNEEAEVRELFEETFAGDEPVVPPEVDDVPPNVFKDAAISFAKRRTHKDVTVDVPYAVFLKNISMTIRDDLDWTKRIPIGNNRHFLRMLQWTRELEADTDWGDGRGFPLMNASGRGRVAAEPHGPKGLKIRLYPDFRGVVVAFKHRAP